MRMQANRSRCRLALVRSKELSAAAIARGWGIDGYALVEVRKHVHPHVCADMAVVRIVIGAAWEVLVAVQHQGRVGLHQKCSMLNAVLCEMDRRRGRPHHRIDPGPGLRRAVGQYKSTVPHRDLPPELELEGAFQQLDVTDGSGEVVVVVHHHRHAVVPIVGVRHQARAKLVVKYSLGAKRKHFLDVAPHDTTVGVRSRGVEKR